MPGIKHDILTLRNVANSRTFRRYRTVTVTNGGGAALSDYQVKVAVTYDADMQSDFSDLSFADANGIPLPHWVEEYTADTSATVWVRMRDIPTGDTDIRMSYGVYGTKGNLSSGYRTFPFFADAQAWANVQEEYGLSLPDQLEVPTPDGTNQTIHPGVVYFENGWNGWKYWMAHTPYAGADITKENPCIAVSNDGITWQEPSGISNPLVGPRSSGHYADCELCYNDQTDELYLYWYTNITNTYINVATSSDGVTWYTIGDVDLSTLSDAEVVADAILGPFTGGSGDEEYSPCVLKTGANEWKYWAATDNGMVHRTSTDGVTWGSTSAVDIGAAGKTIWHMGIIYSPTLEKYVMTSVDSDSYVTIELSVSTDATTWTRYDWPIIRASDTASNNLRNLYRTTLVEIDGDITIWPSFYQNASGFTPYVGRCDPIAVADLVNYASGLFTRNGAWPRYANLSRSLHGGTVDDVDGDLVLDPTYQSGVDAICYVRSGGRTFDNNYAVRARMQPDTDRHIIIGMGELQMQDGGAYDYLLGGPSNSWLWTMFSGSQYLFRCSTTGPTQAATAAAPTVTDDFHVYELQVLSGGKIDMMFDDSSQMAITGQANYISNDKYPYVGQNLAASTVERTNTVDWMLARKCVDTEPTTSVGDEVSDVVALTSGDNLLLVSGDKLRKSLSTKRARTY